MNIRQFPFLLAVLSLVLSSLACGLFSAPEANPAEGAEFPVAQPTKEALPSVDEIPVDSSLPEQPSSPQSDLTSSITTIDTNKDGVIDICEAVPAEEWETLMARPMVGEPTPFEDPSLGKGCAFDFGKDSSEAYFAYITIATEQQFNDALANAVSPEPVTTVGDSAFLNYGPDARQLWVRVGDKAVLVAIGDRENVPAALVMAQYLVSFAGDPGKVDVDYAKDPTTASVNDFSGTWYRVNSGTADSYTPWIKLKISVQGNIIETLYYTGGNTFPSYTSVLYEGNPVEYLPIYQPYKITLTLSGESLHVKAEAHGKTYESDYKK